MADLTARLARSRLWVRGAALGGRGIGLSRALGVVAAAALALDAYAHASDAYIYDGNGSGVLTQGNLFRAEAAASALVALVLVLRPSRWAWVAALTVLASALGAILLYRYVDVGAIGPIPDMYEPTWQVPNKLLAAYAEAAGVALGIAGLITEFGLRPTGRRRHLRHGRRLRLTRFR